MTGADAARNRCQGLLSGSPIISRDQARAPTNSFLFGTTPSKPPQSRSGKPPETARLASGGPEVSRASAGHGPDALARTCEPDGLG
jgi:hypothetical protein